MARNNPIQFQPCLSMPAFLEQYGMEPQCKPPSSSIAGLRDFVCPDCDNTMGLPAGTIFHATHMPLTTWSLVIYLLTQRKKGISALQLSPGARRQLQHRQEEAQHKVLQVMHERNQGETLSGRIEINGAYLGVNDRESAGPALSASSHL